MRIHPREQIVNQANISLSRHIMDWMSEDDSKQLTEAELLTVLIGELSRMAQSTLKYQIRFERHGNYDDPGGLENV